MSEEQSKALAEIEQIKAAIARLEKFLRWASMIYTIALWLLSVTMTAMILMIQAIATPGLILFCLFVPVGVSIHFLIIPKLKRKLEEHSTFLGEMQAEWMPPDKLPMEEYHLKETLKPREKSLVKLQARYKTTRNLPLVFFGTLFVLQLCVMGLLPETFTREIASRGVDLIASIAGIVWVLIFITLSYNLYLTQTIRTLEHEIRRVRGIIGLINPEESFKWSQNQ